MKELKDLTREEYEVLKTKGLLYEYYPEATGCWFKDCNKVKDALISQRPEEYLVSDYFNKQEELYDAIERVVETLEKEDIGYLPCADKDSIRLVRVIKEDSIYVKWTYEYFDEYSEECSLIIPKRFINSFDEEEVITYYKEMEKEEQNSQIKQSLHSFVQSLNGFKQFISLEDIITLYQAKDTEYGNQRTELIDKILEDK